jgi:hypothetical protein
MRRSSAPTPCSAPPQFGRPARQASPAPAPATPSPLAPPLRAAWPARPATKRSRRLTQACSSRLYRQRADQERASSARVCDRRRVIQASKQDAPSTPLKWAERRVHLRAVSSLPPPLVRCNSLLCDRSRTLTRSCAFSTDASVLALRAAVLLGRVMWEARTGLAVAGGRSACR